MRSAVVAVTLAAAAVAAGCDAGDSRDRPPAGTAEHKGVPDGTPATPGRSVREQFGVVAGRDGSAPTLARVDSLSLEPRSGVVRLGEYHDAWSFSPDRSQVALGMGGPGRDVCGAGICVVDLDVMKVRSDVEAPIAVEAVAWLTRRRVVGILQTGEAIVADPASGRTLMRRRVADGPQLSPTVALWRDSVVALFRSAAGGVRLVVIDADGRVRAAPLRGVRLRADPSLPPERAALVVDPGRARALVFAAGASAAEVELRTMRVRYHTVSGLLDPATPDGAHSGIRHAVWLGDGLVAVSGEEVVGDSGSARRLSPGVHVVDTRMWTARTVHARASRARLVDGRLLVYTQIPSSERSAGVGLRVYTRDGKRLVRQLFGSEALDVQVTAALAYARGRGGVHVLRVRPGKRVRQLRTRLDQRIELLGGRIGTGSHAG